MTRQDTITHVLNEVMTFRAKFGWPVAPDMMQELDPQGRRTEANTPPVVTPAFNYDERVQDYTKLREEVEEFVRAERCSEFVDALIDILYYGAGLLLRYGRVNYSSKHTNVSYALKHNHVGATRQLRKSLLNSLIDCHVNFHVDGIRFRQNLFASALDMLNTANTTQLIAMAGEMFMHQAIDIMDALNINTERHFQLVHKANMAKEVATPERPSSRGYTSNDCVKPEGWEAPDHDSVGY